MPFSNRGRVSAQEIDNRIPALCDAAFGNLRLGFCDTSGRNDRALRIPFKNTLRKAFFCPCKLLLIGGIEDFAVRDDCIVHDAPLNINRICKDIQVIEPVSHCRGMIDMAAAPSLRIESARQTHNMIDAFNGIVYGSVQVIVAPIHNFRFQHRANLGM